MKRDPQYLAYAVGAFGASCALLVALGGMPGWYYAVLRWGVCPIAAYGVVRASDLRRRTWLGLLGAAGIVFNPFVPFHFNRDIWGIVDVVSAAVLLCSLWGLRPLASTSNQTGPRSNSVTIEIPDSDAALQDAFEMAGESPTDLYIAALRNWSSDDNVDSAEVSPATGPTADSYFGSFDAYEPFGRVTVDTCEHAGDPVLRTSFAGCWLVRNQGSTVPDTQGIWSLAITRRGQIAVYRYRVDEGVKTAHLNVYASIRDARSSGVPSDILSSAERCLDRRFIQDLDI